MLKSTKRELNDLQYKTKSQQHSNNPIQQKNQKTKNYISTTLPSSTNLREYTSNISTYR